MQRSATECSHDAEDIIGGREIIPEFLTDYPTSLAFSNTPVEFWDNIPDAYVHKIRIQHGSIDQTLAIPDIAGKRLSITYGASGSTAIFATEVSPMVRGSFFSAIAGAAVVSTIRIANGARACDESRCVA